MRLWDRWSISVEEGKERGDETYMIRMIRITKRQRLEMSPRLYRGASPVV